MINVYIDWGVISEMKRGAYPELTKIFSQKERFLVPYSSAHIGDLLPKDWSQADNDYIKDDLSFLSKLTTNRCFFLAKGKLYLDIIEPHENYKERKINRGQFEDFDFDSLKEFANEMDDPNSTIGELLERYKNMPLEESFVQALGKSNKEIEFYFPGLKDDPTVGGLLRSGWKMFEKLFQKDGYLKLREMTQDGMGINRDRMHKHSDPFNVIKSLHEKFNLDTSEFFEPGKYGNPKWFDELYQDFVMLDIHGFQADTLGTRKTRKKTMQNTTDDASHAAFASACHFYVLKDKKSCDKTIEVYKKHGINTLVLKPEDMITIYDKFFKERNLNNDLLYAVNIFHQRPDKIRKEESYSLYSYYCYYFLFDYFNNIHGVVSKKNRLREIILIQTGATNKESVYYFEAKELLEKLYSLFGKDINGRNKVDEEILLKDGWTDIHWNTGRTEYSIRNNDNSLELRIKFNSLKQRFIKFIKSILAPLNL